MSGCEQNAAGPLLPQWGSQRNEHRRIPATASKEASPQNELRERELCALPPFSKLATIRAESTDAGKCEQALVQLKEYLNTSKELASICIAGPLSAAISRKQNRYRYYLHIFAENNKQRFIAQQYTLHFIQHLKQGDLRLYIDVDPIETN